MIVFFVGTPGSGKSYEAVKKVLDNLKLGRTVCTNIDGMQLPESQEYIKNLLDMDDYTFHCRFRFLEKDQIKEFWKTQEVHTLPAFLPPSADRSTSQSIIERNKSEFEDHDVFGDTSSKVSELICPKGSLIIIDEAHKFFNSHDFRETANRELADWASTHRHEGYDVVFITQDAGKVDKQVRTLTEWSFVFRKVNFFGGAVSKKYLCYSYSGEDHNGTPLSKNLRTYDPVFFPAYQSYTSKDAKEVGFMKTVNILKHPVFYAIPVVLAFCLYMFFGRSSFASGDIFGTSKMQHKYDNRVTKGMVQTAKPAFVPVSSSHKQIPQTITGNMPVPSEVSVPPVPLIQNSEYKVDSYIIDNEQTIIQINGIVARLPSPHVLRYNRGAGTALASTSYFGPSSIPSPRPFESPHSPVIPRYNK